jgi:flagellin
MADVNLSKAVRSNLLSLQSTAASMAKTQERLATGLKVNSALDNPSNFFTAASLNSRAGDMANLLDSMSNGIKTIEAADNGLSSITKTVESMQSTLRQARQDKSFKTESYTVALGDTASIDGAEEISFTGGALGTDSVAIDLNQTKATTTSGVDYAALDFNAAGVFGGEALEFTLNHNGKSHTVSISATSDTALSISIDGRTAVSSAVADADAVTGAEMATALNAGFDDAGVAVDVAFAANRFTLESEAGATSADAAVSISGVTGDAPVVAASLGFASSTTVKTDDIGSKTTDQLVAEINANSELQGKIRASNDNGKLRIENQSTEELTVTGVVAAAGTADGESGTATIGGNTVRKNLVNQFNELRDQLDKFADDASFNGINLLRGDKLKLTFNETGTSTIDIQAKDADGDATSISNTTLGITSAVNADFDSDATIDSRLSTLSDALGQLRSLSSSFGSNLSVVQNRQDFTKNMINTLETGAANLTLADTNEEAANLLALQTRQQLSSTALSMASQADQAVLRLF